jgi:coenzyme F420-reducing hydrogenase delta subunit
MPDHDAMKTAKEIYEPHAQGFLEHAVMAKSQYDETCRRLAAEVLILRAEKAAVVSHGVSLEPEICLCAALKMADGYLFRGHRHDDCYLTMGGYQKYTKADGHQAVQGFLTSRGRFVTRAEAADLHGRTGPLFSEDLW